MSTVEQIYQQAEQRRITERLNYAGALSPAEAFEGVPKLRIKGEMLDRPDESIEGGLKITRRYYNDQIQANRSSIATFQGPADLMASAGHRVVAERLYGMAGLSAGDIDVAGGAQERG